MKAGFNYKKKQNNVQKNIYAVEKQPRKRGTIIMGFFKTLFPGDMPLYAGNPDRKYENLGMIEGMFDFDGLSITQSQAAEKAKTELKRVAVSIKADAVVNVKFACLSGQRSSTVLVYGDAVKYLEDIE